MALSQQQPTWKYKVFRLHNCLTVMLIVTIFVVIVPPSVNKGPSNNIGIVSEAITLDCRATGSPVPDIAWLKDGDVINGSSDNNIDIVVFKEGITSTSNLTLSSLFFNDSANYTCQASNNLVSQQLDESQPAVIVINREEILQCILLCYLMKICCRSCSYHKCVCSVCCE